MRAHSGLALLLQLFYSVEVNFACGDCPSPCALKRMVQECPLLQPRMPTPGLRSFATILLARFGVSQQGEIFPGRR